MPRELGLIAVKENEALLTTALRMSAISALKNKLRQTWRYWIDTPGQDAHSERRIFHIICLFSALIFLEVLIQNLVLGQNHLLLPWSLGLLILAGIYSWSRFFAGFHKAWPVFVLLSYGILVVNYFENDGMDGPSLVAAFTTLILLYAISPIRYQWLWVALHISIFGGLLTYQWYFPDAISGYYQETQDRYWDIGLTFAVTVFFASLVMHYIRRNIESQRQQVLTQNRQLETQSEALHKANQNLNKLFSIISHDVRTPLTSLEAFLGLQVQDDSIMTAEERATMNRDLLELTSHTRELLDSLLLWSKGQLEGYTFKPQKVILSEALKNSLQLLSKQAENKQILLKSSLQNEPPLRADPRLLDIAVRNLLSNALKFSKAGDCIWLKGQWEENGHYRISAQDEGIGLPPKVLEALRQEEESLREGTSGEKGVGLGLQLCREFMQLHGGRLEIYNRAQKGAQFDLVFPPKADEID